MDRRLFNRLLAGAAVGALIPITTSAWSQASLLTAGQAPNPRTLTLASSFMEDRSSRAGLVDYQYFATPYVAKDGTLNIYNPIFFRTLGVAPTLDRIYQSPEGPTGWARDRFPLGAQPESRGERTLGLQISSVIMPGANGRPDRLWIRAGATLYASALDPSGAVDANFIRLGTQLGYCPMSGPLPAGSRYFPDVMTRVFSETGSSGGPTGFTLREIINGLPVTPHAADPAAFPTNMNGQVSRKLFPLAGVGQGFYRFVALEETGEVVSILLTLDPASNSFKIADRQVIVAHCASGCVAIHEETPGQVRVTVADLPQLSTYQGVYNPSGADAGKWTLADQQTMTECPPSHGYESRDIKVRTNPLSGVEEFFLSIYRSYVDGSASDDERRDHPAGFSLWISGRRQGNPWPGILPLERDASLVGLFPASPDFAVFRQGLGFENWRHDADGQIDREPIEIASDDATFAKTACYRVGLTFSEGAAPVGGQSFAIGSSFAVRATVNGRHVVLSPTHRMKVPSNSSGGVWVEVLMNDHLAMPTLAFGMAGLGRDLQCDLDAAARKFFGALSEDQLKNAVDPDTGQKIMPNPDSAGAIAQAVQEVMKAAPDSLPVSGAAPAGLVFKSDIPTSWAPLTTAAMARRAATPGRAGPFHLSGNGGAVTFERLERPVAQQRIQAMSAGAIRPMGFFGDVFDAICDFGNLVADGLQTAFDVVVDGVTAAVTIVVDGLRYAFEFVLSAVEFVFDAITNILDLVGFALGRGLRWLLKAIGFVFDWEKILERRDALKSLLHARINGFAQSLPDPRAALADARSHLDAIKATVVGGIRDLRSSPVDKTSFGSMLSGFPAVSSLLSLGPDSLMPQITWVIDKFTSIVGGVPDLGSPNIPALDTAVGRLAHIAFTGFTGAFDDLATLATGWMSNLANFDSSVFDPVLTVIANRIEAIFNALGDILDILGDTLGALRDAPGQILTWLDKPLGKGFANGFWRGLTDDELSIFSVACTVPAVILELGLATMSSRSAFKPHAAGAVRPMAAAAGQADSDLQDAALAFMIAGCLTTTVSTFATAGTSAGSARKIDFYVSTGLTVLDLAMSLGFLVCSTWAGDSKWTAIAISGAVGLAIPIVAVKFARAGNDERGAIRTNLLGLYATYEIIRFVVAGATGAGAGPLSYLLIGAIQSIIAVAVNAKRPFDGETAALIGLAQGALSGAKTAIYRLT